MSKIDVIIMNYLIWLGINNLGGRVFGSGYLGNLVYPVFYRKNGNMIWVENFGEVYLNVSTFSLSCITMLLLDFLIEIEFV